MEGPKRKSQEVNQEPSKVGKIENLVQDPSEDGPFEKLVSLDPYYDLDPDLLRIIMLPEQHDFDKMKKRFYNGEINDDEDLITHLKSKELWTLFCSKIGSVERTINQASLLVHCVNIGIISEPELFEDYSFKRLDDLFRQLVPLLPDIEGFASINQMHIKTHHAYEKEFTSESEKKWTPVFDILNKFLGYGYRVVNSPFRFPGSFNPPKPLLHKLMTTGFNKPYCVYRGVNKIGYLKNEDGSMKQNVTFKGYLSASLTTVEAMRFSRSTGDIPTNILLVFKMDPCIPCIYVGTHERHFIFPHDLKCIFEKIETKDLFLLYNGKPEKRPNSIVIHYKVDPDYKFSQ